MPKRGENIRKRKDGRWEGRYIYKRTDCGKALYRSVYAHSYSDVKKLLEKARHDSYAISAQSESKTFNEAAML